MKADATPTKEFFVNMITKDISLEDCLLDLIDNCLDGVRRKVENLENKQLYESFHAKLEIKPNKFVIKDNCGGISIENAINYAFHFGRRSDAPDEADSSIGLYGIGMKRAILKIGKNISIVSSTEEEAFLCTISVEEWLRHDKWEFDMVKKLFDRWNWNCYRGSRLVWSYCNRIRRCYICQPSYSHRCP